MVNLDKRLIHLNGNVSSKLNPVRCSNCNDRYQNYHNTKILQKVGITYKYFQNEIYTTKYYYASTFATFHFI